MDGWEMIFLLGFGLCSGAKLVLGSVTVDGWNPAPVNMENIPLFIGSYTSQVPGGAGFPPSTDVGCGSQRPLRSQLKVFFPKNANRSETTNHRSFLVTKKRRLFWTYPVQITGNCKCFKVLWLWRFCGMYLSILEKYTVYLYYIYICIYETVIYININMSRYIYIIFQHEWVL